MAEFSSLETWSKACKDKHLKIRRLSRTDAEDTADHYFAGDDPSYDYFLTNGGNLQPNSGYCCVENKDYTYGEVK